MLFGKEYEFSGSGKHEVYFFHRDHHDSSYACNSANSKRVWENHEKIQFWCAGHG